MDWLNLDWLAYFILAVTYVTVVLPLIGDQMSPNWNNSYIYSLTIGAAVHLGLAVFAVTLGSIVWAVIRVL